MTRSCWRSLLALMLATLTSGCLTTAENQAKVNNDRCVARGYQPDTPDFNACLSRVDTEHEVRMQSRRQELLEKSGAPSEPRLLKLRRSRVRCAETTLDPRPPTLAVAAGLLPGR